MRPREYLQTDGRSRYVSPHTPLLRPDRFFAERTVTLGQVLLIVGVLSASSVVTVLGAGWAVTARIDGTVVTDNPARPPDAFCEASDSKLCQEPKRIERDIDTLLWDALESVLLPAVLAGPLVLALASVALHFGSWAVGGSGGFSESLAVASWGLVPLAIEPLVMVVVLWLLFDPITVSGGTAPRMILTQLRTALRPVSRVGTVLTTGFAVWCGAIWRFGLEHERDLSRRKSIGVAAGLVGVYLLIALP